MVESLSRLSPDWENLTRAEQRSLVLCDYEASGRRVADDAFRERLRSGPQPRCFLGWGGTVVTVHEARLCADEAPLCPTSWEYECSLRGSSRFTSSEVNFRDPPDPPLPMYWI